MQTSELASTAFRTLNSLVKPLVRLGVGNPLPIGVGHVLVQTTGRRSGKTREVPLLSMRLGDTMYVSTVRPDSQWVANLKAAPTATVRLFGHDRSATSEVTTVAGIQVATLRLD